MAFGRLERTTGPQPMSDINMTPLIDVMLVLLVIFMITAPLMSSSLKLDLPKSDAATANNGPEFITVSIDPKGQIYLGEESLEAGKLAERISQIAKKNPHTELQLRADITVPYGKVAELIGVVQKAGINRIGFVAELTSPQPIPAP